MTTPEPPPIFTKPPNDDEKYAPDSFFEQTDPFPGFILNQIVPGSEGGVIEAVKRSVTEALREAVTSTGLSVVGGNSDVHVDIEYPLEEESYPGIWVQFSLSQLSPAGLSHELWIQDKDKNWMPMREWTFNGRVTLTIVALTNKARDRISDAVINMFAFSRTPDVILTDPKRDTKQYRDFLSYLDQSPYVSLTVNSDALGCGGQSAQMGQLPWQQDILVYEDNYSFDILGQFNILFKNDGWYTLKQIDVVSQYAADGVDYDPTQWAGPAPIPGTVGGNYRMNNRNMPQPTFADGSTGRVPSTVQSSGVTDGSMGRIPSTTHSLGPTRDTPGPSTGASPPRGAGQQ